MTGIRDIRFWLLAAATGFLVLAAVSPRLNRRQEVFDVMAVVDITGSMNVRDQQIGGQPASRLDFAKATLLQLLASMPCRSRFGLAVFSERRPFMLFEPVETCENFAAITGAVEGLDWRMAWEGDSYVTSGLYRSIDMAQGVGASLLFVSDGHEAPPLPAGGLAPFEGKPGAVTGLIAGVGSYALSPIPKFDADGKEIGFYAAEDVPHENRVGLPPKDARMRGGWHERNAPFGASVALGDEHLSSVRDAHLRELAGRTGLAYAHLEGGPQLAEALFAAAKPRPAETSSAVGFIPAAAALALIVLAYASSLFDSFGRKENPR